MEYRLMEKFGWTPDEIDALDANRLQDLVYIINTEANLKEQENRRRP